MNIRIAIQRQDSPYAPGHTSTYTQRWAEYCQNNHIDHELVDCYEPDIMARLRNFDALLWGFHHRKGADLLMARDVLISAAQIGLEVYPNQASCWHFDDKIAQKYLLEAVDAPLVPTWVFYEKAKALDWLKNAKYPLVRKLRRGAGSYNVGLVHDYDQAASYVRKAFGKGFPAIPGEFRDIGHRLRKIPDWKTLVQRVLQRPARMLERRRELRSMGRESGYALFQEFIPDNQCDTRITVIGNRAWGFRRGVRKNDFRASGSGVIDYDASQVNLECVKISLRVARQLGTQSLAFDYVTDRQGQPWIAEISYGFVPEAVHQCAGYWDDQMNWHEGQVWPEYAMMEDLVARLNQKKSGK